MKKLAIATILLSLSGFSILGAMYYVAADVPDPGLTRPVSVYTTPYEQRDIVIDGVRLRYVDEGVGQPVILIPGHMSRIEQYDSLIKVLRPNFRVLVFDFPGSGYSDKPERDYDLRYYEDILLGFVRALINDGMDDTQQYYLAGGSLGGNLAIRLAYREPERFPRIAAWGPGSTWEAKPFGARIMRVIGGKTLFWPTLRWQSTFWMTDDTPHREYILQEGRKYTREVLSPGFIRMYWGMAADQVGCSLYTIAKRVEVPSLLVLGGMDSTPEMKEGMRRIHKEMPHSEFIVYPKAGHSVETTHATVLAGAISEFFMRAEQDLP
ncbi:alpha/beta fold hydrolase [Patescibacteria group bacterium]